MGEIRSGVADHPIDYADPAVYDLWAATIREVIGRAVVRPPVHVRAGVRRHDRRAARGAARARRPGRSAVPISATAIRARPVRELGVPLARRPRLVREARLPGRRGVDRDDDDDRSASPSASRHGWVPEYGREYSVPKDARGEPWTTDEFVISRAASRRSRTRRARVANRILFCDTDALTTALFHEQYLGSAAPEVEAIAWARRYDLTFLTADDFPWVEDGDRTSTRPATDAAAVRGGAARGRSRWSSSAGRSRRGRRPRWTRSTGSACGHPWRASADAGRVRLYAISQRSKPVTSTEPATSAIDIDARPIVGGRRVDGASTRTLIDPYRNAPLVDVGLADPSMVDQALTAAAAGVHDLAAMPIHERSARLRRAADLIRERKELYASTISRQTGKAIRDARREVDRATYTLGGRRRAAIEQLGEPVPAPDALPGGEGLTAFAIREPLGIVAAVSPFNAPFNLVMHKVAPALAAGNAVVVKPAHQAPLCALQIADLLLEVGFPPAAISVLPAQGETSRALVADDRLDAISFTGGVEAARAIGAAAPLKRLLFELGGNSPNLVHEDADLDWATAALVAGGYSNTGQSCNSVQRVIAHRSIVHELTERLAAAARDLVTGDPLDEGTDVGTLVDEPSAVRVAGWLDEAVEAGATRQAGGARTGAQLDPAVIAGVDPAMRIACEEVFGPVLVVIPYDTVDEAIAIANSTPFGLQGAVFTRSLEVAFKAAHGIRTGAVFVNRSSNFRLDHLPFGGLRESGTTREGGRYTIEGMSQVKLVLVDATMTGRPHPLSRR